MSEFIFIMLIVLAVNWFLTKTDKSSCHLPSCKLTRVSQLEEFAQTVCRSICLID